MSDEEPVSGALRHPTGCSEWGGYSLFSLWVLLSC